MSSTYPGDGASGARPDFEAEPAKDPVGQAREALGQARETVAGEAAHFAERARDEVVEQVEAKSEAATDALSAFADAIRQAGETLGDQDQTYAAKLARQAADGLQSVSRNLAGKSPEDMLHAARDLGRDHPAALFAGAVLAGVAIGRFARSSAHHSGGADVADGVRAPEGSPARAQTGVAGGASPAAGPFSEGD